MHSYTGTCRCGNQTSTWRVENIKPAGLIRWLIRPPDNQPWAHHILPCHWPPTIIDQPWWCLCLKSMMPNPPCFRPPGLWVGRGSLCSAEKATPVKRRRRMTVNAPGLRRFLSWHRLQHSWRFLSWLRMYTTRSSRRIQTQNLCSHTVVETDAGKMQKPCKAGNMDVPCWCDSLCRWHPKAPFGVTSVRCTSPWCPSAGGLRLARAAQLQTALVLWCTDFVKTSNWKRTSKTEDIRLHFTWSSMISMNLPSSSITSSSNCWKMVNQHV